MGGLSMQRPPCFHLAVQHCEFALKFIDKAEVHAALAVVEKFLCDPASRFLKAMGKRVCLTDTILFQSFTPFKATISGLITT